MSRICSQLAQEFTAWQARSLAEVELDYLYLDGTCLRYHPGARAEPVLVAYGITTTGGPVFLGLAPSASDGHDPWIDFLADLTGRGLRSPVLVITDGAPGLLSAVEQAFPAALRQRCLVHRVRNMLAKIQPVPRLRSRPPTGPSSTTSTSRQARPPETRPPAAYRRSPPATSAPLPAAVARLNSPLDDLTVHLWFPREHRQRIRHTNLLERTFGETRRRTKVIGRLPAERSCLTLVGPSWTAPARAGAG